MNCRTYYGAMALLLSACAPAPQTAHRAVADASPRCPADRAPGAGWHRVEGEGPYTVCLPRALERDTSGVGIDTRVMVFRSTSLEVLFGYGVDRGGVPVDPGEPETLTIDGHTAIFRRYRSRAGEAELPFRVGLDVRLPAPPRPPGHPLTGLGYQLGVSARCRTQNDCAIARQIFESIRFQK